MSIKKTAIFICLLAAVTIALSGCLDYSLMDEPTANPEADILEESETPEPSPTPEPTPTPTPTPTPKITLSPKPTPVPTFTPEPTLTPIEIFDPATAFIPGVDTRLYGISLGMSMAEVVEVVGIPELQEDSEYPYGGKFMRYQYRFGWVDFISSAQAPDDFHVCHVEVTDESFVGPRGISIGDNIFNVMVILGYPNPLPSQQAVLYEEAEMTVSILYVGSGTIQINIDYSGDVCYFVINSNDEKVSGYGMGKRID